MEEYVISSIVGGWHCLPDPEGLIANHVLAAKLTTINATPLYFLRRIYIKDRKLQISINTFLYFLPTFPLQNF